MTLRLASAIFKRVPLEIHVRDGSMTRPCATSILLLFVFFAYAWPQTEVASVFGSVTDPSGAVIPGAQPTILNQSTGWKWGAILIFSAAMMAVMYYAMR